MKILIAYDSFFGNTEKIANIIANSFEDGDEVNSSRVDDLEPNHMKGVELLIVGSPTREFRPSASVMIFVGDLPKNSLSGVRIAAFDTRFALSKIKSSVLKFIVGRGGYAADRIVRKLKRKGGIVAIETGGFLVDGVEGPLHEEEERRAAQWAKDLRLAVASA